MRAKAKSRRVLILCHEDLIPPKNVKNIKRADNAVWRTEFYVSNALKRLGHEIQFCGLNDSLQPLAIAIKKFKPDLVFNLLEEFNGESLLESFVVSYLSKMKIPKTGVGALGLILSKNKLAAKKVLFSKRVSVPGDKTYPKIVKLLDEESSRGMSFRSVVKNKSEEVKRKKILRGQFSSRIFSEEYIIGREIHVAVLKSKRTYRASDVWETKFQSNMPVKIISEKVKWDFAYRIKSGIYLAEVKDLSKAVADKIKNLAIKSCLALEVDGHARVDIRLTKDNKIYVLEVNPNPDLAQGDEFAECFRTAGLGYDELIEHIVAHAN